MSCKKKNHPKIVESIDENKFPHRELSFLGINMTFKGNKTKKICFQTFSRTRMQVSSFSNIFYECKMFEKDMAINYLIYIS